MFTHLVFDGVADGPQGVALDVVATAARLVALRPGAGAVGPSALRQRVVSIDGAPVRSGAGRSLSVDGTLALGTLRSGDVLVVPGLGAATPEAIDALLARPDIVHAAPLIARAVAKGVRVAASCSATFVLGAAGVLAGEEATTTWWLARAFAARFPDTTLRADRMVVASGPVVTAGSAFAHADLTLALVADVAGPSLAHRVAQYLVLDARPSQARFMIPEHVRHADPIVRKLEAFIHANLARQVSLAELAHATATSPRTLARRVEAALGTTPHQFVQRLRIARAVHLLETTHASVEAIAASVGYADAAAFRRVFRRERGESPRARTATGQPHRPRLVRAPGAARRA